MKNLIFIFVLFCNFFLVQVFAQDYKIYIDGDAVRSELIKALALKNGSIRGITESDIYVSISNRTDHIVRIASNNAVQKDIHMSDQICKSLKRNMENPRTGESIDGLCFQQAMKVNEVIASISIEVPLDCPECPKDTVWMAEKKEDTWSSDSGTKFVPDEEDPCEDIYKKLLKIEADYNAKVISYAKARRKQKITRRTVEFNGRNCTVTVWRTKGLAWKIGIPFGLIAAGILADGFSDGEWFDWNFTREPSIIPDPNLGGNNDPVVPPPPPPPGLGGNSGG